MGERHLNASWIHTWNNVYKVLQSNPEYLPNTYLQYYLLSKDVVEESNPEYTRANEVMDSREKDLFEGIDHYIKTGEVTAKAILDEMIEANKEFWPELRQALMFCA